MTSRRRQRPVVPATSPLGGDRAPLTPEVENLNIGGAPAPPAPAGPDVENRTPELPESDSAGVPKWASLERKETRLRPDQLEALTALRRRVAAQRRTRSEIITDNTLIRIAVDLLLAHGSRLRGDTEEELLHSVLRRARQALVESGSILEVRE